MAQEEDRDFWVGGARRWGQTVGKLPGGGVNCGVQLDQQNSVSKDNTPACSSLNIAEDMIKKHAFTQPN